VLIDENRSIHAAQEDRACCGKPARDDILAFTAFPHAIWRQIWSNNPQERLNKEIRRHTDVVGIFPGRDAIIRLAGAVLAEQNDERTESRRYMAQEAPTAGPDGAAAVLTPRELEVVKLIAQGLRNCDIAQRLVISEHTVHRHQSSIYRKPSLFSRTAAAAWCMRTGLVQP